MAQHDAPDDLKPEDLQRMLSREYEDRLDWLENQPPKPAPADPATLPHRGFLVALRDFLGRLRRPAGHVD